MKLAQGRPRAGRRDGARGRPVRARGRRRPPTPGRSATNNEDAFLVDDEHALFAVADGMGGHRGGEVASRTAIEALRAVDRDRATGERRDHARQRPRCIERAAGDAELTGMGTTLTAVVVAGGRQLLIGHVGDSRAYLAARRRRCAASPTTTASSRSSCAKAASRPSRPSRTRSARSSRARSASTPTSRSTCTRSTSTPATASCSAPTGSPRWCATATSNASRAASPIRSARPSALVDAANDAGGEDNITRRRRRRARGRRRRRARSRALAGRDSPHRRRAADAPAPDVPEPPPPPPPNRSSIATRAQRRGALLLFVPLAARSSALAIGAVGWYARRSYYVGAAGNAGRDLQGRARRRARLEPDRRPAHGAHRRRPHAGRPRPGRETARRAARSRRAQAYVDRPRTRPSTTHDHDDDDHDEHHDDAERRRPSTTPPRRRPRYRDRGRDRHARRPHAAAAPSSRSACSSSLVTVGGYILVALADGPKLPPGLWRAARVGVRPLPRRAPRGAALRARRRRARCSRSPRCSTASAS